MVAIAGPSRIRLDSPNTDVQLEKASAISSPLETLKSVIPSFNNQTPSGSSSWPPNIKLPDDPIVVGLLSALAGGALVYGGLGGYRRYWRRIRNSNDVTQKMLDSQKWIRGRVTSVGDGGGSIRSRLPLSVLSLSRYGSFWPFRNGHSDNRQLSAVPHSRDILLLPLQDQTDTHQRERSVYSRRRGNVLICQT